MQKDSKSSNNEKSRNALSSNVFSGKCKAKCSQSEKNTPVLSKAEKGIDQHEFTFEDKSYKCNIEYHDELEKLPQYIAKSFSNIQKVEQILINRAKPSIKSSTVNSIIENFGFIDPVIRKKRGKSSEVFKTASTIQFLGPQILKASEELIAKAEEHQDVVKKSMKQFNALHLKEIKELKNRLIFIEKQSKRNIAEANIKIQNLSEKLKKSQANEALLQKKLTEENMNACNKAKNAELSGAKLLEYNEMKSFINFYHHNLLKVMPSYREKMKLLPKQCPYSTLQKVIFLHLGEQTHNYKKVNVENPEINEEPFADKSNHDLSQSSLKKVALNKRVDDSLNLGSQFNNSQYEFIIEREEQEESENSEYYTCNIRTPSMLREFFEEKIKECKNSKMT